MKPTRRVSAALMLATAFAGSAQAATIEHEALGCVPAEQFPRLLARVAPADAVGRVRVMFRGESGPWYAVAMKAEGDVFAAALPRPKKSLKAFSYYVEVQDTQLATSRTEEYRTTVASGEVTCPQGMMGAVATVLSVLVEIPAGAASVPAGFSSVGLIAGTPATAAVGGGAAASGGGSGLGTAALVGGGVAAAAGAVVATGVVGGDGGTPISIGGQVFGNFGINPANTGGPGLYSNPVRGAVVSTSLDSATTTTDGDGRFLLVTNTKSGGDACYTLTIRADGYPTYSLTGGWGDAPRDQIFSLSPPQPTVRPQCQ